MTTQSKINVQVRVESSPNERLPVYFGRQKGQMKLIGSTGQTFSVTPGIYQIAVVMGDEPRVMTFDVSGSPEMYVTFPRLPRASRMAGRTLLVRVANRPNDLFPVFFGRHWKGYTGQLFVVTPGKLNVTVVIDGEDFVKQFDLSGEPHHQTADF